MKYRFHSGTAIVHGVLFGIVLFTVLDHPDVILWAGAVLLSCLLFQSFRLVRKGTPPLSIGICHAVCTIMQVIVLYPIIDQTDFGSGIALFFYLVMLAVFLVLMIICLLIACITRKKPV